MTYHLCHLHFQQQDVSRKITVFQVSLIIFIHGLILVSSIVPNEHECKCATLNNI